MICHREATEKIISNVVRGFVDTCIFAIGKRAFRNYINSSDSKVNSRNILKLVKVCRLFLWNKVHYACAKQLFYCVQWHSICNECGVSIFVTGIYWQVAC